MLAGVKRKSDIYLTFGFELLPTYILEHGMMPIARQDENHWVIAVYLSFNQPYYEEKEEESITGKDLWRA